MSAEYVQILYVGDALAGNSLQACVEPMDWLVYVPKNESEALGMYIGYMPHITIMDGQRSIEKKMVQSVLHHLRTVDASPIVILGNASEWLDANRVSEGIHVVPASISFSNLVLLINDLVERYPRRF